MHVEAPRMPVKCGVDTCYYWHEGHCDASALEVNAMQQNAQTSDDTCCTTFRPAR